MFTLRVLGGAQIEGENGLVTGRAAHKRRLALLALLAVTRTAALGRERLIAYLWPEHPADRGRHLLSESLYVLRKELGDDAFVATGDDVALNPAVVDSDVGGFEAALADGRRADAVGLYKGPLLDGFFVSDAPEFERWVDAERDRLARACAAALEGLATEQEAAGDPGGAVEWWRRLAAHDPYSSRVALRLMQALDAAGERATAVRHAAAHAALLHDDLGIEADAEVAALAERLRGEPGDLAAIRAVSRAPQPVPQLARADAGAERAEPPAALTAVPEPSRTAPVAPAARPGRLRLRWVAAVAATLVLVVVLGSAVLRPVNSEAAADAVASDPTRIAVLFFEDYSPDGDLAYLANGLTVSLIHELSGIPALSLISDNGVRPFRGQYVPLDSIVRTLRVGTIITGSVTRSGDRVRVNVRVADPATGLYLQNQVQERPWGELFSLIDDVVIEVSQTLRRQLGQQVQERRWQTAARSVEAWRLVQQAAELRRSHNELMQPGDFATAITTLETADTLLSRAERLDPSWVEPTVLRGWVAYDRGFIAFHPAQRQLPRVRSWFATAAGHAERVLAVEPDHAGALELRGTVRHRTAVFLMPDDPTEFRVALRAAEAELRDATARDPSRAAAWSELSSVLLQQGKFAEAKAAAEHAYQADAYLSSIVQTVYHLYQTSFELEQHPEATRWCQKLRDRFDNPLIYADCTLAIATWSPVKLTPTEAWALVEEGLQSAPPPVRAVLRPRLELRVAGVLARAGLADSARAVIGRVRGAAAGDADLEFVEAGIRTALQEHDTAAELLGRYLAAHPTQSVSVLRSRVFAPLRAHPRLVDQFGHDQVARLPQ